MPQSEAIIGEPASGTKIKTIAKDIVSRGDMCPCGTGKRFDQCCGKVKGSEHRTIGA